MYKKFYICFVLSLVSFNIYSNDTFYFIAGGNIVPAKENQTNVEMKEEIIVLELFDDYYNVTVDFTFYNNGNDENLLVGFPYFLQKQGGTYSTSIYDFRTWINDILIDHENNKIEFNESGLNERIIDYIFTKNVFFPSNEITKTKVNYKAKYGRASPSYLIASYLYGSGKPWLNTIGKMIIIIKNNLTRERRNWIYELNMKNIEPSQYTYWENGAIKIQLENIDPADYNDLIEIYIGPPLWDIGPTVFKPERFRYKNSIIPIKAIKYFSKSQLRLLRNLYYAFYGYNFKDEELKSFYKNDMSSDWYEIKTDFNEDMITEIERENIKIITEEEKLR